VTRTPKGPRHPVSRVDPNQYMLKADFVKAMSEKEDKHLRELLKEKDNALLVAKEEMSRRLDGMNHLQAQLNKQADSFISKEVYNTEYKNLVGRVDYIREVQLTKADNAFAVAIKRTIDDHIKNQEGKETANSKLIWVVSIIGPMFGALTAWLLMHK